MVDELEFTNRVGADLLQLLARRSDEYLSPQSDQEIFRAMLGPAVVLLAELFRPALANVEDPRRGAQALADFTRRWVLKLLGIAEEKEEAPAEPLADLLGTDARRVEVMESMGTEMLGIGTPRFDLVNRLGKDLAQWLNRCVEKELSSQSDKERWEAMLGPAIGVLAEIFREAVENSDDPRRVAHSLVDFSSYHVLKLLGVTGGEA